MILISLPGLPNQVLLTDPIYEGSHFNWGEATSMGTRLPETTMFEGQRIPAAQITRNIISMAKKLDEVRKLFGDKPIHVTSWLRPPVVNKAVGGVRNSQHLFGWAVDIQIEGIAPFQVAAKLSDSWAGGLGDSKSFTHLDLRHLMGHGAARWDYGNA